MRRWLARVTARTARGARGLWPDHNPLRRTIDRAEAAVVSMLAIIFLAGAPLAAATAGRLAGGSAARAASAYQATWHRVPAALLTAAPAPAPGNYQATVLATWKAPDGAPRTGRISVLPGQGANGTVMVWVDKAGRLTGPPLRSQPRGALAASVLAALATGVVLFCAGLLAHWVLERRRLAAWDADWRVTGPSWTRKR